MSLIVNHVGDVSERGLGRDTTQIAAAMTGHRPTADRQSVTD